PASALRSYKPIVASVAIASDGMRTIGRNNSRLPVVLVQSAIELHQRARVVRMAIPVVIVRPRAEVDAYGVAIVRVRSIMRIKSVVRRPCRFAIPRLKSRASVVSDSATNRPE